MDIKTAREILQEEVADMTDEEVQEMIYRDTEMVKAIMEVIEKDWEAGINTIEELEIRDRLELEKRYKLKKT